MRLLAPLVLALSLAGCACRDQVISPRAPVSLAVATPSDLLPLQESRALRPESLRLETDLVVGAHGLFERSGLSAITLWRAPGDVRVRVDKGQATLADLLVAGDRIALRTEGEIFVGRRGDIAPEVWRQFPLDAELLALVPLLDATFLERLPHLEITDQPRGSCWDDHLHLAGNPSSAAGPWWRQFTAETWALRPETMTVEGLALAIPSLDGEDDLSLEIAIDRYGSADVRGDGESEIVPTAYRITLLERPWRRWFRGERWSIEGEIRETRHGLSVPDRTFRMEIPPGAPVRALRDVRLR